MKALLYDEAVEYEGTNTSLLGVFTDDNLALQALEKVKSKTTVELKEDDVGVGYFSSDGGIEIHLYLIDIEPNVLQE